MRIPALALLLALSPALAWADDDEQPDPPDDAEEAPAPKAKAPPEETPDAAAPEETDAPKAEVTTRGTVSGEQRPKALTLSVELLGAAPLDRGNRDLFGSGGGGSVDTNAVIAAVASCQRRMLTSRVIRADSTAKSSGASASASA